MSAREALGVGVIVAILLTAALVSKYVSEIAAVPLYIVAGLVTGSILR